MNHIQYENEAGTILLVKDSPTVPQIGWRIAIKSNEGTEVFGILSVTESICKDYPNVTMYIITIAPVML